MTSNTKLYNLFNADLNDFDIDMNGTTTHDNGKVKLSFAPVTFKKNNIFFFQTIEESRAPFGISQDQDKPDKHTLMVNCEAKDEKQAPMVDAYIAKHNALDDRLTEILAAKSDHEGWWSSKQDVATLKFARTPTVRKGGISKLKKRPFPPGIKFAIAKNSQTKEAMFDAYINTSEDQNKVSWAKFEGNNLDSVPKNSEVTGIYGYPQVWKSNDKSWGVRWKLMQVFRHRVSSVGFQKPQGMLFGNFESSQPMDVVDTTEYGVDATTTDTDSGFSIKEDEGMQVY